MSGRPVPPALDAELAARQARLCLQVLLLHIATCERCQLAQSLRITKLACERVVVLTRRWARSLGAALYYARS